MKTNLKAILLIAIVVMLISSCKKGDTGSAGPRGPEGATGSTGATGDDGTIILSGTTVPDPTKGRIGDFYLNLSTSDMYGPKTNDGWGTPYNLKGDKGNKGETGDKGEKGDKGDAGDTGAAGSRIWSGTTVPSSNMGNAGDYYLETNTYLFYGPKTSVGWGMPINLKGAKGDKGDKGEPGKDAQVISTDWITINNWQGIITFFNTGTYTPDAELLNSIGASSVGEFIKSSGIILVYAKNNAMQYITSLPETLLTCNVYALFNTDNSYENDISIYIRANDVSIDVTNAITNVIKNYTFRFIFIPSTAISTMAQNKGLKINDVMATEHLRTMSYKEVSQLFNFKN